MAWNPEQLSPLEPEPRIPEDRERELEEHLRKSERQREAGVHRPSWLRKLFARRRPAR